MGRRKGQVAAMASLQLVKDRHRRPGRPPGHDSFLHTTELNDGTTYNRINFQSVTEQNNLEDFLTTAEMAGRDFTAERQAVQIITNPGQGVRLTTDDLEKINEAQRIHKASLQIPRRPPWNKTTTKEELILAERESFTNWRRQLKMLEEEEHIQLTPYEKNLDFWRQLWRVIERSDVIVQIVDARNPLLFRCEDLETYVRQVDPHKTCMLLVNKADFLTSAQREEWVKYFDQEGIKAVFFSAKTEKEAQETQKEDTTESKSHKFGESEEESFSEDEEDDVSHDEDGNSKSSNTEKGPLDSSRMTAENTKSSPGGDNSTGDLDADMDSLQINATELSSHADTGCASCNVVSAPSTQAGALSNTPLTDGCDSSDRTLNSSSQAGNSSEPSHPSPRKESFDQGDYNESQVSSTSSSKDKDTCSSENLTSASSSKDRGTLSNSAKIVTSEELLDIVRGLAKPAASHRGPEAVRTVGMVGYPNVGKSSTINVILDTKKLAVSATPGRTKHLQTLHVDPHLVLCDCPGLVFPSFVATKAHLVINGILPIDELRQHTPPVTLICEHIPRDFLEATYSIMIPRPSLDDLDPSRPPTAEELLNAYGAMRGFMTPRGVPDCPRAARYILKDYVKGKLLYCEPPPGLSGPEFQDHTLVAELFQHKTTAKAPPPQIRSDVDREFFNEKRVKANSRGVHGVKDCVRIDTLQHKARASDSGMALEAAGGSQFGSMSSVASGATSSCAGVGKPWKKHNNRNKKEKLRRLHRDLDV